MIKKERIDCFRCGRYFYTEDNFENHRCSGKKVSINDRLQLAREEYKRTGKMTPERACVLLNCQPAVDLYKSKIELLRELPVFREIDDKIIAFIRYIEKTIGIGNTLTPSKISARATYIVCFLAGMSWVSQGKIAEIFNITAVTLRDGLGNFIINEVPFSCNWWTKQKILKSKGYSISIKKKKEKNNSDIKPFYMMKGALNYSILVANEDETDKYKKMGKREYEHRKKVGLGNYKYKK